MKQVLYTRFGLEFPAESAEDTLRRLPNVRHDALVIYNSKDAAWIEGTLSAELEQCPPYYSIVLPQRTRLRGDSSGGFPLQNSPSRSRPHAAAISVLSVCCLRNPVLDFVLTSVAELGQSEKRSCLK